MSERKDHYYLVKGGKALEAIETWNREYKENADKAISMMEEFGANEVFRWSDCISGFGFEKDPGAPWRKNKRGAYIPDKRTKEGKNLEARISSVKIPDSWYFEKLLGGGSVFTARFLYHPTLEKIGDNYVLFIPENPEADKQFVPPDDVVRLKDSEYWALKEKAA